MANELSMYRGDDLTLTVTVTNNGTAIDISGSTVYLTLKSDEADLDAVAIYQYSTSSHSDPTNGITTLSIPASSSVNFSVGRYYYDIQYKSSTGIIATLVKSTIDVKGDITRSIA